MKKLYEFCKQIVDINGKPLAAMVRRTARDGRQRETIIAASVYAVQPSTMPYRVVLRFECHKDGGVVVGKWIIHNQVMETSPPTKDDPGCQFNKHGELDHRCARSSWDNGNYFDAVDYIGALMRFYERCHREIEFHKSLKRAAQEPDGTIKR